MSDIFIKRVAKLLGGLPSHGFSESSKPIRASANVHKIPQQVGLSEFELHNQVLRNVWGAIEFEIEPLNQGSSISRMLPAMDEYSERGGEFDYKVRVKTKHRMMPAHDLNYPALSGVPVSLKAISNEQARTLVRQHQQQMEPQVYGEKGCVSVEHKEANAKQFACRESRRMMTLINQRKEQASLLQEKTLFANFALPVLESMAKSPHTPTSSLKWLACHESPAIRKAVAKNANTDLDTLAILARDENESIRFAVAENPLVDKEFLLKLLDDDQDTVVQKIKDMLLEMTRSQANESNRATLSALKDYVDEVESNKEHTASDADFMQVIASKNTTPVHRLAQLAKHDDWNVRLAVANNPRTTWRTLAALAKDPVVLVRRKALTNPNCLSDIMFNEQG